MELTLLHLIIGIIVGLITIPWLTIQGYVLWESRQKAIIYYRIKENFPLELEKSKEESTSSPLMAVRLEVLVKTRTPIENVALNIFGAFSKKIKLKIETHTGCKYDIEKHVDNEVTINFTLLDDDDQIYIILYTDEPISIYEFIEKINVRSKSKVVTKDQTSPRDKHVCTLTHILEIKKYRNIARWVSWFITICVVVAGVVLYAKALLTLSRDRANFADFSARLEYFEQKAQKTIQDTDQLNKNIQEQLVVIKEFFNPDNDSIHTKE